ncbi:hypothetical protein H012_gp027 [Acanthamoeba polyphaga moumouvirus]|uniref:Uncharacterized protein n=1 Tax=Acanthamoeba polyphaga moumouvirus TaxID=1269028 RepID=L7RDQ8_9VIRU|nr:hypothetical protein H012_gp027 [Acanthamoeba polyphaga moumouvirus]AGC02421.1 hypothetical protein Moumou_00906 [Acanthamoeba polyphaga moumouvirus]
MVIIENCNIIINKIKYKDNHNIKRIMVISDLIYLKNKESCFPTIFLKKDKNHKKYSFFDKKTHPKHVENIEALFLIKEARKSFLTHKKIKDKYIKKKYNKSKLSVYNVNTHFYLSGDKKFYAVYINVTENDFMGCCLGYYLFGIIERSSEKHLLIEYEFISGVSEGLNIIHNLFNYCVSDKYDDQISVVDPPIMISIKTDDIINDHHKPLDIIDSLEDYFLTFFEELSSLDQNDVEEN